MVREKEDTYYKIVETAPSLFSVYTKKKSYSKEWTLLVEGLTQVPFCAEKFILRQHYKSNEWEEHRFSGQSIKHGRNEIYPSWEVDRKKERRDLEMIAGWIYVDTSECSKESLHNFSKGYFSKYLNNEEDWINPQMDSKCKKTGREIEIDSLFLRCPRGHKDHAMLARACECYQGTALSSRMYEKCKMQDIYFKDFADYVNNNSLGLYDDKDREALYEVYDIIVECYKKGKSANQALRKAKAIFRASKKAIKDGTLDSYRIERNRLQLVRKRDKALKELVG